MVLPGTAERFLGANPWAIGIPAGARAPVVVDISTAVVAEGKVQVALAEGQKLPAGCIVDRNGDPTVEPADYFNGGGLLPLGGLLAGHKGFGLGLAAALVGSLCMIGDDHPSLAGAPVRPGADPRGRVAGVLVIALDPGMFGERQAYEEMVAETLRAVGRAGAGHDTRVPGEPEAAARLVNSATVTLPEATRDELAELAGRFGLTLPG
jgi:LDH2 family malate/lactate/ureidoglycolate dehydrogenase